MPYTSLWAQIPFVGRIEQLRRLMEHRVHLEGARDRVRHVVVVEGFNGVGKTALADEFLARISRDETVSTARGAYSPYLRRSPLAPVLEGLDELCSSGFLRRRLLPLFTDQTYRPLLGRLPLVSGIVGIDADTPVAADAETLASLAATLLVHIARFRPVVLFLDDAHAMPEEDRQALVALNAGLRRAPVLIVMAVRQDLPESSTLVSAVEPIIADRIHTPPLNPGEVAEMVTRLCGAKVSALLATEIARLSGGSPQRTLEILTLLRENGTLRIGRGGEWHPGPGFTGMLTIDEESPAERIDRLAPRERMLMLLLECVGGLARRDELAEWFGALSDDDPDDMAGALRRLEESRLVKSVYARPDEVMVAHERSRDEVLGGVAESDLDAVAAMVVRNPAVRREVRRWCGHAPLLRAILRQLPPVGSTERDELLRPFVSLTKPYQDDADTARAREIYGILCDSREYLDPREQAYTLLQAAWLDFALARFATAMSLSEELRRLTMEQESCASLRALAIANLATARFFNDRTTDISELLSEAEAALAQMSDTAERSYAEMMIARVQAMQVPPGMPGEAIDRARRVYFLLDQLGFEQDKRTMFTFIVINAARARDEGQLRLFCSMLSQELRQGGGGSLFQLVFQAVRSSILIGDIFQAREIFETWSSRSAPVGVHEFMLHAHLTSLFALADAEPSLAADMALSGREEFLRLRATSKHIHWDLVYAYVALQAGLFTSLPAAGRYSEALEMTGFMEKEMGESGAQIPGLMHFLHLVRSWLVWRSALPADAPTSLSWSLPHGTHAGTRSRIDQALSSPEVRTAAEEFRHVHRTTLTGLPPQTRFHAEMLLAQMESVEGNQDLALASVERAAAACAEAYSWHFDLDSRAAAITLRIRQAVAAPELVASLLPQAVEQIRELFATMTEKGLAARIAQLTAMFLAELEPLGRSARTIATQIEKTGSGAQVAAHLVLRNSRSKGQGPIERARLFIMGPLRLMRPYSYMELSESAFERETARTLLIALAAAAVLGQTLTREELAMRIAPKARTQEQQKKALYNAASAARAACGSPNSILPLGASSLELNVTPELDGSVWIDVLELVRAVKRGEELESAGSISAAFEAYQQAMLLASKGELASDCYAEWIDPARDHIRDTIRGAALSIGRIALRNGLYSAGIEAVNAQLTRDPYDEESHRILIELYRESGNRTAALKQFEKCRAVLMEEFGVEPERETQMLRRQLVEAG
jgi:DNA-binding SARP family transcriptional activator